MWGLPTCSDPGPAEMKGCLSPASGPPRPQCLQLEGQQSCCSWLKPVAGLSPPPTPPDVIQPSLPCFAEDTQAQRGLVACPRSHSKLEAEPGLATKSLDSKSRPHSLSPKLGCLGAYPGELERPRVREDSWELCLFEVTT